VVASVGGFDHKRPRLEAVVVRPASDAASEISPAYQADHIRTLAVIARRCLFMIVAFSVRGAAGEHASAPRLLVVLLACLIVERGNALADLPYVGAGRRN
jgi:hypothetical protein